MVGAVPNAVKKFRFHTFNKKYVLWNVYLPNALYSVCLNRLSCTEVGIYNGANSPNGFPKFKKGRSCDPFTTPFNLILHFFVKTPSGQSVCQI